MERELLIFDNIDEVMNHAALKWIETETAILREKSVFMAALSGGKTLVPFLQKLATSEVSWNATHLFQADERYVPPGHADNNFRMIRENLIDRIDIPDENVHPVATDAASVQAAAALYELTIRQCFRSFGASVPEFDLIILGIGEDGHTASLFPGDPAVKEGTRLVASVILNDADKHDRVTLTLPILNHAKNIIFLLTGKEKASILEKIWENPGTSFPAAMVRPLHGRLCFLADTKAGAEVKRSTPGMMI